MVVFGWLFDGSPWWHDALVIGLGMVAAAVGNAPGCAALTAAA